MEGMRANSPDRAILIGISRPLPSRIVTTSKRAYLPHVRSGPAHSGRGR